MVGKRINTIIGRSCNKIIDKGDVCVLGACPRYEGYSGAPSRTIVVGGADKGQSEFLEHGLRAHELAVEKYVFGKPATRFSDYDFPRNIVSMIDIGLYGHPVYYGFRHEEAYLIDEEGITRKLTDLPMRVYESR